MPTVTVFTSDTSKGLTQAMADQPHRMYLYLEYTNGTVPSYTTAGAVPGSTDPLAYYFGLTGSQNFLRVPAIRDPNVVSSSVGAAYSSTVTFFGQSSSLTTGSNPGGAALSDVSSCYGAALVLAVDDEDRTKDLVVARAYFTDSPITKTSTSEIFVTFPFTASITVP